VIHLDAQALLNSLSATDKINITLCVLSFLLSAISVVAVVLTLRQNNKMIEASTRPYISVSYQTLHPGSGPVYYFMIKNYGATGAQMVEMKCSISDGNHLDRQFAKIPGTYFAPGQKVLYYFDNKIINDEYVSFEFSYKTHKQLYSETQTIRIKTGATSVRIGSAPAGPNVLQDIAENLL
jgi:hypothetical protein